MTVKKLPTPFLLIGLILFIFACGVPSQQGGPSFTASPLHHQIVPVNI